MLKGCVAFIEMTFVSMNAKLNKMVRGFGYCFFFLSFCQQFDVAQEALNRDG